MKPARHQPIADTCWLALALALIWIFQPQASAFAFTSATNAIIQYHARTWQIDEGLPQNAVQALAQSQGGYLWLATQKGLGRFDGVRFKVLNEQNTPGLKNSSINVLCQSADGSLWIGTAGGLIRLKDGNFSSVFLTDDPRGNNIKALLESKDGSLWVGTLAGLFHQENGSWKHFTQRDGLCDNVVHSLCEAGDTLWIGTAFGVNILQSGVITTRTGISDKAVRMILKDRQGTFWFGLTTGLGCLRDNQFTLYTRKDGLADNHVSALYEDRRGELWIGTYGGLSRRVEGKFITEKDAHGSYYDQVNAIGEDREGDIWVGTRDGLQELSVRQFTSYTRQDGLPHNNIMSVLEDRKGNIWLGTWGGGLACLNDSGVASYNWEKGQSNGLSTDLILSLFEDRDGSILIGTDYEGGTFRLKDGNFSRVWSQEQAMVDRVIRVIYRDREGNLWFGASPGLVLWNQRQKFLQENVVRCLLEDHSGNLWVGTETGLFCRQDGKFFNWTAKEDRLHDVILSLYEDRAGNLWIGTRNSGLGRYRDGRLTTYTTKQGLHSDDIFEILEDDHGWLWMSGSQGISRVSKKNIDDYDRTKSGIIVAIAYGRADGMESIQCNGVSKPAGWKSRDGRLWFATAKGVVVTAPNLGLNSNQHPPPVLIEEIMADKQPVAAKASPGTPAGADALELRVAPGHGDLEFHYTALTFQAPEKICFKYKLEGVDPDWVEVTQRTASYNNLAPGSYRFQVKACNNDGVWNEKGVSVAVVLAPHFWQTWWFMGSVAMCAVAMAGGTVRYATRRNMEQELQRLEKQNAVEEERIRIARDMHDEIGAKLTKISFLGAMAKRKLLLPGEAGAQIDKMSQTAREVIRALDEIVWAVNPANDTLEHLATYLCRNTTEFFENSHIQCQFKIPDELPACRLRTDVRHNILLAAKEAMNNILKHAGATNVLVEISVQSDKLEVVIADNGCGFQREGGSGAAGVTRAVRVGSGLKNMHYRLAVIGGRCEVKSGAGQGTQIIFKVLLKERLET